MARHVPGDQAYIIVTELKFVAEEREEPMVSHVYLWASSGYFESI